jgi:hypothetical protein
VKIGENCEDWERSVKIGRELWRLGENCEDWERMWRLGEALDKGAGFFNRLYSTCTANALPRKLLKVLETAQ